MLVVVVVVLSSVSEPFAAHVLCRNGAVFLDAVPSRSTVFAPSAARGYPWDPRRSEGSSAGEALLRTRDETTRDQ